MPSKSAKEEPKKVREVITGKSKSASELEAEIAAAATAIGEAKTSKPEQPKTVASKKTDSPKSTEDEGVKIVVNRSQATPSSSENNKPEAAPKITGHKGKKIVPLTKPETPAVTEKAAKPKPETVASEPKEAVAADKNDALPELSGPEAAAKDTTKEAADVKSRSEETEHKLDQITDELKTKEAAKDPADDTPQTAKIYDTKKYHVPIKVNRHHRRAAVPVWAEVLILIIGLAGAFVYAAWADIIDVDLPYLEKSDSAIIVESNDAGLESAPSEIVVNADADKEVAASVTSVFEYQDNFNSGDIAVDLISGDLKYALSGQFHINKDGALLVDLVGDRGREALENRLQSLIGLSYQDSTNFDEPRTVEFLPNPDLVAHVSAGSLFEVSKLLAGSSQDMLLVFSDELYQASNSCKTAKDQVIDAYSTLSLLSTDIQADVKSVISAYNALPEACTDEAQDTPLIDLSSVTTASVDVEQTGSQVVLVASDGERSTTTITLSNLTKDDASSIFTDVNVASSPEFVAQRYLDLVLVSACDEEAFSDYKVGDSVSGLAKAADCSTIE